MLFKGIMLAMAFAPATAAIADPESDTAPVTEQVSYADLDLATAAGQTMLQRRIEAAATRVCDMGGMQRLEDFAQSSHCYAKAHQQGLRELRQLVASRATSRTVVASALVVSRK
jgi:UrcA family protein